VPYRQNLPTQESERISIVFTGNGRKDAVIEAGHAAEYRRNNGRELVVDGGIRVTIHDRNGGPPTIMSAGRGIVHDNQDIEGFDHVVIRSGDGTVVSTEHIVRSGSDRMLRSERFVTITKPSQTIRGYGFESDETMKRYRIFKASGQTGSK
jgi:LPS export ABC transporter protein LptC